MVYTLRFFLQNAVCFIIVTYLVLVLFTFSIQVVLKLKKNNSGAKRLKPIHLDWELLPNHGIILTAAFVILFRSP